jgi:hypothetical protein
MDASRVRYPSLYECSLLTHLQCINSHLPSTLKRLLCLPVEVEVNTTDSLSASQSRCQEPIWDPRKIFLSHEISIRQLGVCYFVAPSLTRGQVSNLLLLLFLASSVALGSESRRTQDHILLSQFLRLSQPLGPGPQLYPRALCSLSVASYDSQVYGGGILTRLHTEKSEIFLLYHI